MIPRLERRLGKLETKLKPHALRAAIDAFLDWSVTADSEDVPAPLPPNDPRLEQGVDDYGDAVISRWWAVSFFEGTRDQQETRLKELRQDPQFQKPMNEGEPPVYYQGGARFEDLIARIEEEERRKQTLRHQA